MKILVVASEVPASSSMPGSPRLFSLCRELSRKHELHLITRCLTDDRRRRFVADDATRGVFASFTTLPNPPATAAWWDRQRHRVLRGAHFESRYLYPDYHQEVCDTIRALAAGQRVDVAYVDSLAMAQYVEDAGTLPALIDIHDSLTLLALRMMRAEGQWKKKLLLYLQSREMAKRERALANRFALVVTNSPVDEAAIRRLRPSTRTMVIENGVDTEFFKPDGTSADPRRLIFTGVLGYPPNEDAAVYFCQVILPLIRRQCPDTEFWAVGSEPTPRVQSLAEITGVHVAADVPDVRPYLQSAGVFVCPLRSGAGVKNKILAALAMGKPLVATRLSMEGLDFQAGRDLLVADDPQEFADAVVGLVKDRDGREALARNGHDQVKQRYSWRASADLLDHALGNVTQSDHAAARPRS